MIEGLLPKPLISRRSVPRQSLFELKNENNHWKWERTDVVANCSCYLNVCYPAQNRALINFHNFSMILFLRNQETNDIFIKLSYDLKCSTTLHYLPINITLLTPLYILYTYHYETRTLTSIATVIWSTSHLESSFSTSKYVIWSAS